MENQATIDQELNPRLVSGLMIIGILGWLIMCGSAILLGPYPSGVLALTPPTSTPYLDYTRFQMYAGFSVLGSCLVGVGLFGFFLRFKNYFFLVASLTSFLATILTWRCKLYPDWRFPSSGYTIEMISAFDSIFIASLFLLILPMLLFGFGFYKIDDRPESLDLGVFFIVCISGYALLLISGFIVNKLSSTLSVSRIWGLAGAYALTIMVIEYIIVLFFCGKEFSWIFKGAKPKPRTRERYWWRIDQLHTR